MEGRLIWRGRGDVLAVPDFRAHSRLGDLTFSEPEIHRASATSSSPPAPKAGLAAAL
jgi:hypothetical protein